MFYRLSTYAIAAALFPLSTATANEAFPGGIWRDGDRTLVVSIAPCPAEASTFCGSLIEDNRPGPAANPQGHQLVRGLKKDRAGWKGKIVDGGTQLNFTMRPQNGDAAQVRFCFGVLCETEVWQRVSSVPVSTMPPRR
jgi:uncharacterized protein (DUF2147 family)